MSYTIRDKNTKEVVDVVDAVNREGLIESYDYSSEYFDIEESA